MEATAPSPTSLSRITNDRFWRWLCCAIVVLAAWMVCCYHGGEQSRVLIHDCLDSYVPTLAVLAKSDVFFAGSDAVFAPLLGGIPRNCMPSEMNLYVLPYRFMSAFGAIVFCEFVLRVVALLGMALLLRRHLIPQSPNFVVCGAAFCFALLPFYPNVGLSVAGQPLLLYAILNLRNRNLALRNWLIVGLFPFLSSAVMVGFVLVSLLGVAVLYEAFFRRQATGILLLACGMLTAGYAIAEYRLVAQVFTASSFVSHRVEFAFHHTYRLGTSISRVIENFIDGDKQLESVQYPVMFLACLLALVAGLATKRHRADTSVAAEFPVADAAAASHDEILGIVILCLSCGIMSLCYGLYDWTATGQIIAATGVKLLRAVQFQRVHWLHPMCWGLAFAYALALLSRKSRLGILLAGLLIVLQAGAAAQANYATSYLQKDSAREDPALRLSFHEFFSPELFGEVKAYLGKSRQNCRVVSLGLHPVIALYNGLSTADGYWVNYPLEYKHRFRAIMAPELAREPALRAYFDNWGSRCYLMSHELGKQFLYTKKSLRREIEQLQLNPEALTALGITHILSAVRIANYQALGLKFEKKFERNDSPWEIFLYAVPNVPHRYAPLQVNAH
jgi:hypothetical protein